MVFTKKDIIVPEKKFSRKESLINLDFQGKTALVCGSSKGIGRATAIGLAKLNANVILLSRSEAILQDLCKSLPGSGRHSYLAVDVSDLQKLKEKVENALVDYGSIQILINNTGGPKGGLISSATEEEFVSAFRNHLLVNSLLTGLVLPGMKEFGYGRIINILSTSVKIPIPNLGVSNTVRAAVANWSKTLAGEVAGFGITVNNVLPGYTDTERLSFLMQSAADRQNKPLSEIKKAWIDTIPAGRLGLPEEIANAVVFLASPAASYINGVNLPVDGGRTGSL